MTTTTSDPLVLSSLDQVADRLAAERMSALLHSARTTPYRTTSRGPERIELKGAGPIGEEEVVVRIASTPFRHLRATYRHHGGTALHVEDLTRQLHPQANLKRLSTMHDHRATIERWATIMALREPMPQGMLPRIAGTDSIPASIHPRLNAAASLCVAYVSATLANVGMAGDFFASIELQTPVDDAPPLAVTVRSASKVGSIQPDLPLLGAPVAARLAEIAPKAVQIQRGGTSGSIQIVRLQVNLAVRPATAAAAMRAMALESLADLPFSLDGR